MSTTTTAPEWTVTAWSHEGKPEAAFIKFGKHFIRVTKRGPCDWIFDCTSLCLLSERLKDISTLEQAIAEAVVAITQCVAQLSAELNAIPLILS